MYFLFSLVPATLAALSPMAGAYATYAGLPSLGTMMRSMHSGQ